MIYNLNVNDEVWKILKSQAAIRKKSIREIINTLIEKWLEKEKKKGKEN